MWGLEGQLEEEALMKAPLFHMENVEVALEVFEGQNLPRNVEECLKETGRQEQLIN